MHADAAFRSALRSDRATRISCSPWHIRSRFDSPHHRRVSWTRLHTGSLGAAPTMTTVAAGA